jgi:serine/threonine protein kinase
MNFIREHLLFQVVKLLDHFCHNFGFYLVLEYVVSGLPEMLHDDDIILNDSQLKTYARMLLNGVVHMHATNIMHRVSDYKTCISNYE